MPASPSLSSFDVLIQNTEQGANKNRKQELVAEGRDVCKATKYAAKLVIKKRKLRNPYPGLQ